MHDPSESPFHPSRPDGTLSSVSNDVSRCDTEREHLDLALRLGSDPACVWSSDSVAGCIDGSRDRRVFPPARPESRLPARQPTGGRRQSFGQTVDGDSLLSTRSVTRVYAHGTSACGITGAIGQPGHMQPCIHDVFNGPGPRATTENTDGSPKAARNHAHERRASGSSTPQRSAPWKLRRDNSNGVGIPVVWRGAGPDAEMSQIAQGYPKSGIWCSVLELQLIPGDGSNEIYQCPGTGHRILGHIIADTTDAPRQTGSADKTSYGHEKPEEQTYKLIGGTKFQYWLTSEPHGSMEGLNVLLEILPDFPIHMVQSTQLIEPAFRYAGLVCGPFQ
jgi:hypothetical protein